MAHFDWNETFSVKVRSIDDQHRKLVALMNQFHDAIQKGQGERVLARILTELSNYAGYHFRTEEALMDAHSYPGRHQHLGDHNGFWEKMQTFGKIQGTEGSHVPEELSAFLRDWLAHHIKGVDMQLGTFLNKRGIT